MKKINILFLIILVISIIPITNAEIIDKCENNEKDWQINKCYSDLAIELNDSSLCKNSKEYSGNCNYQIALKTNDISLCEKAEMFKPECLRYFAVQTGNFDLCGDESTEECLIKGIKESKKYELCLNLENPAECFKLIYYDTKDNKICQFLEDKPNVNLIAECRCESDETIKDGKCVKLECKQFQAAEKNSCVNRCDEDEIYRGGLMPCFKKCSYWFTKYGFTSYFDPGGCGDGWLSEVLFYLSIELPFIFLLFVVFILLSKTDFIKSRTSLLKKDYIRSGLFSMFIYLNVTIFLFSLSSKPSAIIELFFNYTIIDIYSDIYSLTAPIVMGIFFLLPFFLGIFNFFMFKLIRKKEYKYIKIIENALISLGILIFVYFFRFFYKFFEESIFAVYLIPYWKYFYNFIYRYLHPSLHIITEVVYTFIFIFMLVITIRFIFDLFLRQAWLEIVKYVPGLFKKLVKMALIFLPFMALIGIVGILNYNSIAYFSNALYELGFDKILIFFGIKEDFYKIEIYYTIIFYSLIWSILFILAELVSNKITKNFKKKFA